jgi:exonuclease SbcC
MRVLELALRNYRVFEEVDLELPARVIGIFGENGAGKSSLMESIAFALYGVDAARTKKDGIRTQGLLTDCVVRIVFEHAGQQYEIRRAIKGRNHTPDAELLVGGKTLATGTSEVTAEVVRLLHMDLPVFRASVFAEQKQLDALSDQTPGKRKEMALRLLGIKPVDDARTSARREAKAKKHGADQLAGAVADTTELEASLAATVAATAKAAEHAQQAGAELRSATVAATAARSTFARLDEARQRVEKLTVEITGTTQERSHLEERRLELERRIASIATRLETLPVLREELAGLEGADERLVSARRIAEADAALTAAVKELEAASVPDRASLTAATTEASAAAAEGRDRVSRTTAARDRAVADLDDAEAHLLRASEADPSAPCPTCGQPLGAGFAAYLKTRKTEAAAAKRALTAAEKELKTATGTLKAAERTLAQATQADDAARERAEAHARLEARVGELRGRLSELVEAFDGATPDLTAAEVSAARAREIGHEIASLDELADRRSETERDRAEVSERLQRLESRLASLTAEAEDTSFDAEEHAGSQEAVAVAEAALERARDHERAAADRLAKVEAEQRELTARLDEARRTVEVVRELREDGRYLERTSMLLDGFRDHLVGRVGPELSREAEALFRELTDRDYDDLRIHDETLAIEIADGESYFPVSRFSGSETDLANLALRVAISSHLSRVSGADVGFMVLDEVLGSLDQERKDLLVQAMGRLASRFHQLFVITHAEQVKDQFPAAILVRKTGRRRSAAVLA